MANHIKPLNVCQWNEHDIVLLKIKYNHNFNIKWLDTFETSSTLLDTGHRKRLPKNFIDAMFIILAKWIIARHTDKKW